MTRPKLNVRSTSERLIQILSQGDKVADTAETLSKMFRLHLQLMREADKEGYKRPSDKSLWHPWLLVLEDGNKHTLYEARTAGPAKSALVKAIESYLLGELPYYPDYKALALPEIARGILKSDGLNPDACEQMGQITGRFAITINGKHHGANRMRDKWEAVRVIVSKDPEVFVGTDAITLRMKLSDSVKLGVKGKMLTEIVEHPAFNGYKIESVTTRDAGMTLKVKRIDA